MQGALKSERVKVVNADALQWLEENREFSTSSSSTFPDPANFALGKLYTSAFYRLLEKRLSAVV